MANKVTKAYVRIKTPAGWKRYPAVIASNGRVKSGLAVVNGEEQSFEHGIYELRYFVGSKTKWIRVNGGAQDASRELKLANAQAEARVSANKTGVKLASDQSRKYITETVKAFVQAASERGSDEASETYERAMSSFTRSCRKTFVDELDNKDVSRWLGEMRKDGYSDRTIANRYANFRAFLGFAGFDREQVKAIAGPKPKYEKGLPEIYSTAQLKKFFEILTEEYDRLLFRVLLEAGLREQEAQYLTYDRVDHEGLAFVVASNPIYGFKVKDGEARRVPISQNLADALIAWRDSRPGTRVVFGARGGKKDEPDGHLLRRLKGLVRKAGLNCGHCEGCNKGRRDCEQWFLHKFRATCLTRLLQSGMDIRSVMAFAGHSDMKSTMRYIRPLDHEQVQSRVAAMQWL